MAVEDEELDPFLQFLLGGMSTGGQGYSPLYRPSTLGGMMATPPLEPPEIPNVNAAALGQDIPTQGGETQESPQTIDPYLLYLLAMGGPGGQGGMGGPGGY
jgi:hypothetical protein